MLGANTTLTIRTASLGEEPERDAEGRLVRSWTEEVTTRGAIWTTASRELVDGLWTEVRGWRAIVDPDIPVSHTSVVDVDGAVYRVKTVRARRGAFGLHHQELELVEVTDG
jgi:hypothetical protein